MRQQFLEFALAIALTLAAAIVIASGVNASRLMGEEKTGKIEGLAPTGGVAGQAVGSSGD